MSAQLTAEKHFIIDFDSTFTKVEALDILGEISLNGHPERDLRLQQIAEVTDRGMAGEMSLRESLEARISILDAHQHHMDELVDRLRQLSFLKKMPPIPTSYPMGSKTSSYR